MYSDEIRIDALLADAVTRLLPTSDSAVHDARVLLCHVIGQSPSYLMARPEEIVRMELSQRFEALVSRRENKEPIAYLTGHKEFWSLDLIVTPSTLIPRPETEVLVETALSRIPTGQTVSVADLGTGSGAIAFALAKERPKATIHATESSKSALTIAHENRERLGLGNVFFKNVDHWYPDDNEEFNYIVSNPPYVASTHENLLNNEIAHEPQLALVAGRDGLDAIREIIALTPQRLEPGGWLLLEHGFDQREAVGQLMLDAGFEQVGCVQDLAGIDRVTEGRLTR